MEDKTTLPPIERELEPLNDKLVEAFAKATSSKHFTHFPPTIATRFREAEFEWLRKMQVDMRTLLHVEQEYEFLAPLKLGEKIHVKTRISEWKERRGMTFVTLETALSALGEVKVNSYTHFLLQKPAEEKK